MQVTIQSSLNYTTIIIIIILYGKVIVSCHDFPIVVLYQQLVPYQLVSYFTLFGHMLLIIARAYKPLTIVNDLNHSTRSYLLYMSMKPATALIR